MSSTAWGMIILLTYQHQFVKTPFPCIWSNRDMSLFSFWPISPQFCIVKSTKASEKWSHMGEGLGGPLFHALGMVFRLFWGIFVIFLQWEGVFKGLFATFPAFSIRQNTFPLQKSGKFNGKVFWQIVIKPKAMKRCFCDGKGFSTKCNCWKCDGKAFTKTHSLGL